ncbi:MAG: tRNA (N(6)-L-threonylcarbamoyladenosine(37)-C(2))-methylthiotransferase MtaB [Bacteroidales bacterium]|nr:tRNA (N(6)-L-threonylcarbamoyladenosine(37)-C(2))-methylthiotransferase MtaB [Bacteroidales bacterium]
MKIAFTTLGCKLNYAETATYERGFMAAGWDVVPWTVRADVYLINTCAVTETAEKKSRNLIRRAHKTAPEARIVVTGCYAELRKDQLLAIDGVWKVFGATEKQMIVPTVAEALSPESSLRDPSHRQAGGSLPLMRPRVATDSGDNASSTFGAYSSGEERTRSFLKVQDGCDNFCAYCTVPYARGRSRNLAICEVVKMAEHIAADGVKEVVLTGVNTGDFGRTSGESFLDLLKALNEVKGIERYRISSIEPNLITPEIVDWIASGTKFQRHFHIPLQSGSDTLLRRVGRRYDTDLFASRIDYIRQALERPGQPKVFFGIDVIAGLPGETEQLFMETYNFLKERIRPAFIHVFPYSRRPGTRAAEWKDQVQDSVKTERVARLEALCAELHRDFVSAHQGIKETVLWESSVKDGLMGGYTGNYIRVEKPFDPASVNQLEEITL